MIYLIDYLDEVWYPTKFTKNQTLTIFNERAVIITATKDERKLGESFLKMGENDNQYATMSLKEENELENFILENKDKLKTLGV